jgi:hypothetical protein
MSQRMEINKQEVKWKATKKNHTVETVRHLIENKGNNKITELRTILQRESQNS